jgi:hypothetical protein
VASSSTIDLALGRRVMVPRLVGGGSGVVAGVLAGLVPTLAGPSLLALVPGETADLPLGIVSLAITGAALGPLVLRRGRMAALSVGLLWAFVTLVALALAQSAARMIAFTAQNWLVPDLGSQLALILFGLGMGVLYLLAGLLVGGAAWATMARALNRIVERRQLTFETVQWASRSRAEPLSPWAQRSSWPVSS